jgi:hypothetical protein
LMSMLIAAIGWKIKRIATQPTTTDEISEQ